MLVLTRTREETIMIGDNVEITIVDIRGDKVRLGINAPRDVQVHRKEVYDAIRRENAAAARVGLDDLAAANAKMRRAPKAPGRPGAKPAGDAADPSSTNLNGNAQTGPRA